MAGCLTAVDIDLRNDDLISRYSLTPFYPDQDPEGTNLNLLQLLSSILSGGRWRHLVLFPFDPSFAFLLHDLLSTLILSFQFQTACLHCYKTCLMQYSIPNFLLYLSLFPFTWSMIAHIYMVYQKVNLWCQETICLPWDPYRIKSTASISIPLAY